MKYIRHLWELLRNKNQPRWFNWSVQVAMILAAYLAIQAYYTRDTPSGLSPTIAGQLLDGRIISLGHSLDKPVLVHFWATWCTICRIEQGSINNIAKDYDVIAIASQSGSENKVRKIVSERNITVPVLVDEYGDFARQFGVKAFPTSFVIDINGKITYKEVGYTTEAGLRTRLWLAAK